MSDWVSFGSSWFIMVQNGRICASWNLKIFFSILKKRISDGAEVPCFFRDLIAMITDVSEEEWGTQKDPSTKLTKENTLRNYSKRGLSKKFAESIVYRLDRNLFVELIN